MKLATSNRDLEFIPKPLLLHQSGLSNLFAKKNNKTLAETLKVKKYKHLTSHAFQRYPDFLNDGLGEFLYRLKTVNDDFYRRFLNLYGDGIFCEFSMAEPLHLKGLYCFLLEDAVTYIGRSQKPFSQRINQGYGHISPKNCFRDGQATNCRINSLVAKDFQQIKFFVCPLDSRDEINHLEKALIGQYRPLWNIA